MVSDGWVDHAGRGRRDGCHCGEEVGKTPVLEWTVARRVFGICSQQCCVLRDCGVFEGSKNHRLPWDCGGFGCGHGGCWRGTGQLRSPHVLCFRFLLPVVLIIVMYSFVQKVTYQGEKPLNMPNPAETSFSSYSFTYPNCSRLFFSFLIVDNSFSTVPLSCSTNLQVKILLPSFSFSTLQARVALQAVNRNERNHAFRLEFDSLLTVESTRNSISSTCSPPKQRRSAM